MPGKKSITENKVANPGTGFVLFKPNSPEVIKITSILDELFPVVEPPLQSLDTFTFLVAVVLSAQCKDERVNAVTEKLFKVASTPQDMVNLGPEKLQEYLSGLGLSRSKSRYIVQLSDKIINKFNGQVPASFADLESLPGVGHKTASVVMAQSFGIPAFPVDTHIHRLAKRWHLSDGKSVEKTEEDLKKIFPKEDWNRKHMQIIFFGRLYCPALKHKPELCPICSWIEKTK